MVRSTRLGGHKEMLSDRNYIWMLEDRVKRRDKTIQEQSQVIEDLRERLRDSQTELGIRSATQNNTEYIRRV